MEMSIRPGSSRRKFLAGAIAFGAIPWEPESASAARPWKTAIGYNGFESSGRKHGKAYPLEDVLKFAREEGFDGVELVERWPAAGMNGYPVSGDAGAIAKLRVPTDRHGLQIFSIQLGTAEAFDPDESVRAKWLELFADRCRLARALGCEQVGLWPGGGLRGQTMDEALDRLGASYGKAGAIAAEHGLSAAFEIEPPFVFNTEAHAKRILAAANHPALQMIYDPSHFDLMNGSSGRPHEMLERIGVANFGYIHLTDTDGTLRDGGTSKHLACGDGHANIPASLASLKRGGFRGWVMIDAWEIPDAYDACRKGKKMIEAALADGGK